MNHKYTLKKNHEISKLVSLHKSVGNKSYIVYYAEADDLKIAISVSKKLGKAFFRNRQKRILKEIIRNNLIEFKNLHCLIVIKQNSVNLEYSQKQDELLRLIKKIRRN